MKDNLQEQEFQRIRVAEQHEAVLIVQLQYEWSMIAFVTASNEESTGNGLRALADAEGKQHQQDWSTTAASEKNGKEKP